MIMVGTKRLWLRRWMRMGVFLNALFNPRGVMKFISNNWGWVFISIPIAIVWMFARAIYIDVTDDNNASAEQLKEAAASHWCVAELLPRRQTVDLKGGAIRMKDVRLAIKDCKEAQIKFAKEAADKVQAAEQAKILKEARPK